MCRKSETLESLPTLIPGRQLSQNDCCSTQEGWQKCMRFVHNTDLSLNLLLSFGKGITKIKPKPQSPK